MRCTLALMLGSVLLAGCQAQNYRVTQTYHIGGEGRWDYVTVDPKFKELYVSRSTHTQVIDCANGKVVGDIGDTPGVHGIALLTNRSPKFVQVGFTSNGKGNSVTMFDIENFKVIDVIKNVGDGPDCILYDASSGKVLTFNGHSEDVSVIDPGGDDKSGSRVQHIALPGKPEYAVTDGLGHIFVNLEDKSAIAAIDTKTWKITHVWKIEGGDEPSGLAIDVAHHLLFAGCHNEVMAIVDTETGTTLGLVPIGKGVDACAFDPGTGEAFASCGDGTLTVIKDKIPGHFEVVQKLTTRPGARTMALDPTTHTIYLPTAEMVPPTTQSSRPGFKPDTFMIVVVSR